MPFGSEGTAPGIGLALSGGGFRAVLFHVGSIIRLNEFGLLANQRVAVGMRQPRVHVGQFAHERVHPTDHQLIARLGRRFTLGL